MPKAHIRQARKEARARREIEEQLRAEEEALLKKKQDLIEEKLQRRASRELESLLKGDSSPASSNMSEPQKVKWKTTQVIVQAGSANEIPLEVHPDDTVEWGFKTDGGDIAFCVLLEREDGGVVTLVQKDRVPSDEESITGSLVCEENGRVWLQWDNTYSWLTNKELTYSVSVTEKNTDGTAAVPEIATTTASTEPAAEAEAEAKEVLPAVVTSTEEAQQAAPAIPENPSSPVQRKENGTVPSSPPPKIIFILGGPSSGKGTQCQLLSKEFGFVHLSAGDLLREERNNPESKDGALIQAYIREGKIVPIEITVKLLMNAMKKYPSECYLVDGFPRNRDNLQGWVRETGSTVQVLGVLFFDCPEEILVARALERGRTSGRSDDNPESIQKRLRTYANDTMPIVEHFQKQGQVCTISTDRPIEEIFDELKGVVKMIVFNEKPPAQKEKQLQPSPKKQDVVEVSLPALPAPADIKIDDVEEPVPPSPPSQNKKNLRVILGTMTMYSQVDLENSVEMFDSFASSLCVRKHLTGGRMEIDTARMYNKGETEVLLGKIFAQRPDLRKSTFVASKANPFPGYNDTLRPENVISQCNESLKAMGLSSMDVFYLHSPDHNTPIERTLEAVQELYLEGKFRELGLSNYSAWQTVQIYYICKERGYVLPTVYQGMYNAITRDVERELLPALRALNIRFYAYNPLAGGLLTGKHKSLAQTPADGRFVDLKYRNRFWKPAYFQALDMIESACTEAGDLTMASASIAWLMHHSKLSGGLNDGVILGASSLRQLEENLQAASIQNDLPEKVVAAFDNAWDVCKPSCPSYLR